MSIVSNDSFGYTLRQERLKLVTVSKSSVLTKNIVTRTLLPILDQLDQIYQGALHKVGQRWVEILKAEMINIAPSGKRYRIIEVDFDAPKAQRGQPSQRYKQVGDWTASAPGQPPAKLTETLLHTLSYRIKNSTLIIGQLIGVSGDEDLVGTEIHSAFFRGANRADLREGYSGRLFVSDDADQTPVREYSNILEQTIRPWFGKIMSQIRDELKEELRDEIWASIKKKTRSTQIRKALIVKIYMTQA